MRDRETTGWWRPFWRFVREVSRPAGSALPDEPVINPERTAPEPRTAAACQAARDALRRGDAAVAEETAREALEQTPTDLFARFYLGRALLRQGRFAEARAVFATVAADEDPFGLATGWLRELDRHDEAGWRPAPPAAAQASFELERKARTALRNGRYEQARDLAAEAVAADPENLLAHHLLGQAWLALADRDQAVAVYTAALAHDDGLGVVTSWLAAAETAPLGPPAVGWDELLDEAEAAEG